MTTERWEIDSSHSGIQFTVRHLVIAKGRGQFSRWTGTLIAPQNDFTRATLDVEIDASSIDTGVADRDAHLRSADFFDAERYPEITFKSTGVTQTGADRLSLAGALACNAHGRGLSLKPIVDQVEAFDLMDPNGEVRTCSRGMNADVFRLAIGGYGLFGVITRVTLRLRPRVKVRWASRNSPL